MTVIEVFQQDPNFYNITPDNYQLWRDISIQARRHTTKNDDTTLEQAARPNESPEITQYRKDNKRNLSLSVVTEFIAKTNRIFRNSGISLDDETVSPELMQWLESKPFPYLNQSVGLMDWAFNCLIPSIIEDPNAVLVAFPFNSDNPNIPPNFPESEGGLPTNRRVSVECKLIPSEDIRYFKDGVFAYQGGQTVIERDKGRIKKTVPFYYAVDSSWWYILVPSFQKVDNQERVIYDLVSWYNHSTGSLPVTVLPGLLTTADNGQKYNLSILASAFEQLDVFNSRYSDTNAVWNYHAFPHKAFVPMDCDAPGCINGKVKVLDKDGNTAIQNGAPVIHSCEKCKGTGIVKALNPHEAIIKGRKSDFDKDKLGPLVEWFTPPQENVAYLMEHPFKFLKNARISAGLGVTEESGQESGEAKKRRLETLRDILSQLAMGINGTLTAHLWHVESLLILDPERRQMVTFKIPTTLEEKDLDLLLENVKNSPFSDRRRAQMEYLKELHGGQSKATRIQELATAYSPLLVMTDEEVRTAITSGAYGKNDMIKRDYAVLAVTELIRQGVDFSGLSLRESFNLIDNFIRALGVLKDEPLVLFGGEDE